MNYIESKLYGGRNRTRSEQGLSCMHPHRDREIGKRYGGPVGKRKSVLARESI